MVVRGRKCLEKRMVEDVNAYIEADYDRTNVFDPKIYEDVLNKEECVKQIKYIVENNVLLLGRFLDASLRIPRSIQKGNLLDIGSYYECLEIKENEEDMNIEGKYCMMKIPLGQNISMDSLSTKLDLPQMMWSEFNPKIFEINNSTYNDLISQIALKRQLQLLVGITPKNIQRDDDENPLSDISIELAVCIPKTCSLQNALNTILDLQPTDLQIEEAYCRLPNDKPWVAADYVALVIFTLLGIVIVLSTAYDLRLQIFLKKDPKTTNKLLLSYSVYTNTIRLVTYKPSPGALECVDGIRAFAMMWVIIGHTFVNLMSVNMLHNPSDVKKFVISFWSLWISSAPITVDTFFALSGLLLVYSTAGKVTGLKLIKNLHLFYLNRYLRLFPLLAACILLQASLFHRVSDGPMWEEVAIQTERCRKYWWSTLLYIQNYYNPTSMCLPHTWYLAIDWQLFLISPIILFWVVSSKKTTAWIALIAGLLVSLTGASIYNFTVGFKSSLGALGPQRENQPDYLSYYYVNTLTRAPPFFVGMIFGYILHLQRGKKLVMSKALVTLLWLLAIILSSAVIYSHYIVIQEDWENHIVDDILNSYMRSVWALSVCWMIFACVHGYGGPINWILSHPMWKILGRLSYAMYLFHYPLIFVVNGTSVVSLYFSTEVSVQRFLADFVIAVLAAYLITLFVDAPSSVLIKHFLGGGGGGGERRPEPVKPWNGTDNQTVANKSNSNLEAPDHEIINKVDL
ncbi:O-acyltransferase like protein-like [Galleria mellonella]|uniref:O-acyltransferase like protein-like n=1 Tax=Galleria mellonella TaxID=7137 RepID=A0ABM3MXV6_GALME|nr:O-acyltransferase like protein-like [Galleria mellonella]